MTAFRLFTLLVLAVAAARCLAKSQYDYGYGSDNYGDHGGKDKARNEYNGYSADEFDGYEDYYVKPFATVEECSFNNNGQPVLSGGIASCDIQVAGVDKQADKLTGGLDGVYKLTSCYNGKPMYKRVDSPAGEDRVLWYSITFGDWDVSKGAEPNEAEVLMYGGEMERASVPLFVGSWHLSNDLKSDTAQGEYDYIPINVAVACSDGTAASETTTGPVLTDDELEAKYRDVYEKSSTADPTAEQSSKPTVETDPSLEKSQS